nr:arsenate reductase ArsC [Zobellella iuensis]
MFICTENSARSQMAEALLRHHASHMFDVFSAGPAPQTVDTRAIESIERFGLSGEGLVSKAVDLFADRYFDFVIVLCDRAARECELPQAYGTCLMWDFEDPKSRAGQRPFDLTLRELNERIKLFVLIQSKNDGTLMP